MTEPKPIGYYAERVTRPLYDQREIDKAKDPEPARLVKIGSGTLTAWVPGWWLRQRPGVTR